MPINLDAFAQLADDSDPRERLIVPSVLREFITELRAARDVVDAARKVIDPAEKLLTNKQRDWAALFALEQALARFEEVARSEP